MTIAALDQGTTSTRALTLAPDGSATVVRAVEHRQIHPRPGWVEHDSEALVANLIACAEAVPGLTALGLDNQGESCLAWDADTTEPLSPVIVWQDTRTEDTIAALKRDGAEALVLERAGLPLDSYFSASKLAWILATLPEARRAHARGRLRLGTTDAFFFHRLTGRCITDITTASRTALMNLRTGSWDPDLCALFGVPMDCLPTIVPTTGDFGAMTVNGAAVPVLAGIVDQQAALYGHGCREPGATKVTFGTGAFALTLTGATPLRAPDQGLLPTVAWQLDGDAPVYALDGGVYCAGAAVNWARDLGLFTDTAALDTLAGPPALDQGLAFVPALAGLACPHWDRAARGAWLGLGADQGPEMLMKAVLEGIACRAAEVVLTMQALTGGHHPLSVDGGLSRNPYFLGFLADILEREVTVAPSAELTAIGTARLVARTLGQEPPPAPPARTITPMVPRRALLARFADAVSLTRQWSERSPPLPPPSSAPSA